jgi:hypothetical protein
MSNAKDQESARSKKHDIQLSKIPQLIFKDDEERFKPFLGIILPLEILFINHAKKELDFLQAIKENREEVDLDDKKLYFFHRMIMPNVFGLTLSGALSLLLYLKIWNIDAPAAYQEFYRASAAYKNEGPPKRQTQHSQNTKGDPSIQKMDYLSQSAKLANEDPKIFKKRFLGEHSWRLRIVSAFFFGVGFLFGASWGRYKLRELSNKYQTVLDPIYPNNKPNIESFPSADEDQERLKRAIS